MRLTNGQRLKSVVDATEVIVVRAPGQDIDVTCGGRSMIPIDTEHPGDLGVEDGWSGETLIGKRYAHDDLGLELLCTRGGQAALGVDGQVLGMKQAKALPASD
ncbi:hypothetical protein [Mycolicibacterium vinylchloridicum]|uniref:hypothetical protein n=1 Tax=Mycolicibacterium vinylchloridicum TaxID=2736928 RepID=UPI0015CC8594|nr:hypothetical protein [Mycolicibacterium vinylchloridicum]